MAPPDAFGEAIAAGPAAAEAPAPAIPIAAPAEPALAWSAEEIRANLVWAGAMLALLAAVFALLVLLPTVGWPLLTAVVGAYLLDPLVTALAARGLSRARATLLLFGSGALVGGGGLLVLAPVLWRQAEGLPDYLVQTFSTVLPELQVRFGGALPGDWDGFVAWAESHLEEIVTQVLPGAAGMLRVVLGQSLSLLSFVIGAFVVLLVGMTLLERWPEALRAADALVPPRQRSVFRARMAEVDRVLGGFVRGQLTLAAVLAGIYSVVLSLIGLKLGVVAGLATGFGNLVPYAGTTLGIVLASGFCLVDFGVDRHLALVALTFAVVVAADQLFLTPRIVGNRVGLAPAAVIVAVLACGSLFGFAGVLLAVPSAALLRLVGGVLLQCHRQSRYFRAP